MYQGNNNLYLRVFSVVEMLGFVWFVNRNTFDNDALEQGGHVVRTKWF